MDDEPVLYILMRSDMASLNPGKACAQAAHAMSMLVENFSLGMKNSAELFREWVEQGRYFGTTIVLSTDDVVPLHSYVGMAMTLKLATGVVHDPTYPIKDGDCTHHIPVDTCAYIFGRRSVVEPLLGDLELMA